MTPLEMERCCQEGVIMTCGGVWKRCNCHYCEKTCGERKVVVTYLSAACFRLKKQMEGREEKRRSKNVEYEGRKRWKGVWKEGKEGE